MGHMDDEEAEAGSETASLNADVHLNFFKEVFGIYNLNFVDWCICLISDNASTNIRLSKFTGMPHIGCNSHRLNLEVNQIISSHLDLGRTIECVRDTMKSAKMKLKNAAVLRNITDLKPKLYNNTRWSGKCAILTRFDKMRDDLVQAIEHPKSDLLVPTSVIFAKKTKKYAGMLRAIDEVTKSLQKDGHLVSDCRDDLDALIESVSDQRTEKSSPFYNCRLGTRYIARDAAIVQDVPFESAVVKIQKRNGK